MQTAHIIRVEKPSGLGRCMTIRDAGYDVRVHVVSNYNFGIADPVVAKFGCIQWRGRTIPVGLYLPVRTP